MANGYPLSAVVGKADYMDRMNDTEASGTFNLEAFALAASLATLKELREKNVVEHLYRMGQRLIDGLNESCRSHGIVGPLAYSDPVPSMVRFMWKPHRTEFDDPIHTYFFGKCYRYGPFFCNWHVAFVNYSHKEEDIDAALEMCDFVMGKTKQKFYTQCR